MTDIPTEPQAHEGDTILAALAHGITGNPNTGLTMLIPLLSKSPACAVGVCAALAASAQHHTPALPAGASFGLIALNPDGTPAHIDDLPTGPRFAAQFTAAWANGQRDTARALFAALAESEDPDQLDGLIDGIRVLYGMAVSALAANRPT